jgi:asparagine synthase (glutamine-hydrolysing)
MCGIQITKSKKENGISHRGISSVYGVKDKWHYHFASLPLSSNEKGLEQPLKLDSGILLFNGEIFNYKDFGKYKSDLHYLKDLFSRGIHNKRFNTEYKKWDGFWAICYIDEKGVLFFTDPLGKKQLYYSKLGICSEIKPINNDSLTMPSPKFGTLNTKFNSVLRAMPGKFYVYEYENGLAYGLKINIKDYLFQPPSTLTLYELINKSVKLRSEKSYGKLGLLFSGGLDSSIIAYHLLENNIPFTAISIDNNEKERCEKISSYLGFKPIFISNKITEEEKVEVFRSYEYDMDLGSVIPQYLLFKKCKELGLHTVLTGDGADELFGGYSRSQESDTYEYDVLMELPYYHHVRLDRCSMAHTVECRNPFLASDIVNFSRKLPQIERTNKYILKKIYNEKIPFVGSKKRPLRPTGSKEDNYNNGKKLFDYAFKKRVPAH